jgi:hypothetical protein
MLELHFDPLSAHLIPPFPPVLRVMIVGPEMRTDPGNAVVAVYHQHFWHVISVYSTSAAILGKCTVHFEEEGARSPTYGPADGCGLANGFFRLGLASTDVLARYDEAEGRWFVEPERQHYPSVLIESA